MKRIDQVLVEKGLARSRSQAKDLLASNCVLLNGQQATKAATQVSEEDELSVVNNSITKYVSRAGLKLESAIKHLQVNPEGLEVLDLGISTGGFSDCLLQAGVKKIIGIDVGHDQLAAKIKNDPRVDSYEGFNARELSADKALLEKVKNVSLVVMDVSFISITKIIPELKNCGLRKGFSLLSLVKPQFELSKKELNKQGIVKNSDSYPEVKENVIFELKNQGFSVEDYFESSIKGGDGNKEFFVYAKANF